MGAVGVGGQCGVRATTSNTSLLLPERKAGREGHGDVSWSRGPGWGREVEVSRMGLGTPS